MLVKRAGDVLRLEQIDGLEPCREPNRKPSDAVVAWSKPALRVIPLTDEQLALVRKSYDPTAALRYACITHMPPKMTGLTPSGH